MVSRVEIFLILMLLLALGIGLSNRIEINHARSKTKVAKKRAELFDASSMEVNGSGVTNRYYASHAVLINGVWVMRDFRATNKDIRLLKSKKAIRDGSIDLLKGNVVMIKSDGSISKAQKVVYDRKRDILKSIGPFTRIKGKAYQKGIDFFYEGKLKRTKAKRVYARFPLKRSQLQ